MNCPRCENSVLDERERDGLNIDVCRAFRAGWLDPGELLPPEEPARLEP